MTEQQTQRVDPNLPTVTSLAAAKEWFNKNTGQLRCLADGRQQTVASLAEAKTFYQPAENKDKPAS